jgi:hypothetical protein
LAGKEDSRSQRAASIPFKTGIVISVTITSGQRRRASDTNVAPSVAVPTMSNWRFKSAVVALSKAGWSSASSTRGRIRVSPPFRVEGRPLYRAKISRVKFQNSELFSAQHAGFCYWGNP